ncbi:MAG: zinc-finger domain-containing protein [Pseudomonadota bacterium]
MAGIEQNKQAVVELLASDLNANGGIYCPSPVAGMKVWNTHPRVYLDIASTGQNKCSYCGTVYKLKAGEHFGGGH